MELWQGLGALGGAWECSDEFGRVRESLGVGESMGELGIVYESFGAIGRIFKLLGECPSTLKGLGKFGITRK